MKTNTTRFSDRVEDYVKYRPHYPNELMELLKSTLGLTQDTIIADIGSGTGISTLPFLENGNRVYAVEPNKEMRLAAESMLKRFSNFTSIAATAEETGLPDGSIDLVFCGQSFHWFDRQQAKAEFQRILKGEGHIVLAWNERDTKSAFQKEYEALLMNSIPEYAKSTHRNIPDTEIQKFFSPKKMELHSLSNHQDFDLSGLEGRLLSSSYAPKEGEEYETLMEKVKSLYFKFANNGKVRFEYETKIYWC